jgi:hypothetical protein
MIHYLNNLTVLSGDNLYLPQLMPLSPCSGPNFVLFAELSKPDTVLHKQKNEFYFAEICIQDLI